MSEIFESDTQPLSSEDLKAIEDITIHPTIEFSTLHNEDVLDFTHLFREKYDDEVYNLISRNSFQRARDSLIEIPDVNDEYGAFKINPRVARNILTGLLDRIDDPWFKGTFFQQAFESFELVNKTLVGNARQNHVSPNLLLSTYIRPYNQTLFLDFEANPLGSKPEKTGLHWELRNHGLSIIYMNGSGNRVKETINSLDIPDTWGNEHDPDFDPAANCAQAILFENVSRYIYQNTPGMRNAEKNVSRNPTIPQWVSLRKIPEFTYTIPNR